jgi:hypothetical protein
MSDGFEPVGNKHTQHGGKQLRLYPSSTGGYLTAAAVREFFDDCETVTLAVNRKNSRLGIRAGSDGPGDTYALTKGDYDSASVAVRTALRELGVETDALEQNWRFDLETDGPYVVADLAELVETATGAVHCEDCGQRFASEGGKNNHQTRTHGDHAKEVLENTDPDAVGEPFPAGGDGDV